MGASNSSVYRIHSEQGFNPLGVAALPVLLKKGTGRPVLFAADVFGTLWNCGVEIGKVDVCA